MNNMGKQLFLFFFLLYLNPCFVEASSNRSYIEKEANCSNIDITDSKPQLKEHFKNPRDQAAIGWCNGFTSADLLTWEIGTPVSATHVSLLFNRKKALHIERAPTQEKLKLQKEYIDNFESILEGGAIHETINAVVSNRYVCTEKDLPYDYNGLDDTRQILKTIEKHHKLILEGKNIKKECPDPDHNHNFHGNRHSIDKAIERANNQNLNVTLANAISIACGGKSLRVPRLRPKVKEKPKNSSVRYNTNSQSALRKYQNEIDNLLNKNKPVAISYENGFVQTIEGKHASIVTARRMKNGVCQYKVRNAFGKTCFAYKPNVECVQNEGAFWVDKKTFFEMQLGYTYIE